MKLTSRIIEIITGNSGLPEEEAKRYRELAESRGIDLSNYPYRPKPNIEAHKPVAIINIQNRDDPVPVKWTPPDEIENCAHRGKHLRTQACKPCKGTREVDVFECDVFGECTLHNFQAMNPKSGRRIKSCAACEFKVPQKANTARHVLDWSILKDNWSGCGVFLCLGGPSLCDQKDDLELIQKTRGVMVAATNQTSATMVRPNIHFSVDKPMKFHESIWMDPAIFKFIRNPELNSNFVRKVDSKFVNDRPVKECPNVFGTECVTYEAKDKSATFPLDETMLTGPVTWGGTDQLDIIKKGRAVRNVMIYSLGMLYRLGFRRVYLMGANFNMEFGNSYCFGTENKDAHACGTNNNTYSIMQAWFQKLEPVFRGKGFFVYNCTQGGNLYAFERMRVSEAIARERGLMRLHHLPLNETPDTEGYYYR